MPDLGWGVQTRGREADKARAAEAGSGLQMDTRLVSAEVTGTTEDDTLRLLLGAAEAGRTADTDVTAAVADAFAVGVLRVAPGAIVVADDGRCLLAEAAGVDAPSAEATGVCLAAAPAGVVLQLVALKGVKAGLAVTTDDRGAGVMVGVLEVTFGVLWGAMITSVLGVTAAWLLTRKGLDEGGGGAPRIGSKASGDAISRDMAVSKENSRAGC